MIDAPVAEHDDDDISKTLKDIGVDYTHRNENLIAENAIEVEKMKALMEVRHVHLVRGLKLISYIATEEEIIQTWQVVADHSQISG